MPARAADALLSRLGMRVWSAPRPRRQLVAEAIVWLACVALVVFAWCGDRLWFEHHVFWRYCAVAGSELMGIRVGRWCCVALAVVLALVVRPALGRWAARRTARDAVAVVARIGGAAALALLVSEGVLRVFWKRPPPPHPLALPDSRDDALYGWVHEPSRVETLSYPDRTITYFIDADGNRVPSPDPPRDPTKPTIVFAGESVALGLGLDYGQTYVSLVEARLGIPAVNVSVTAYGNDQTYLRVRDELPRLAKPVAVVQLVLPVQLVRDVDPTRAHHVPRDDGTFEEIAAEPKWWTSSPLRQIVVAIAGVHSDEAIRVARATFRATARDARARGAFPLFVFTNWGPGCLPDEKGSPPLERALFDGLEVDHVRVDLDPAWWDQPIDHPSTRAHVAIADAVVAALRAKGVVR